jgi:hypothetical protein
MAKGFCIGSLESSVGSRQSALKSREGVLQGRQFSACREVSQERVLHGPQSRQPHLGIDNSQEANGEWLRAKGFCIGSLESSVGSGQSRRRE